MRKIAGAMASTSSVGAMKIRINTLGTAMASPVQIRPNTAAVPRAYFRVSRILPPSPAPKLVERIG